MKKLFPVISLILALAVALCFAACSCESKRSGGGKSSSEDSTPQPSPQPTAAPGDSSARVPEWVIVPEIDGDQFPVEPSVDEFPFDLSDLAIVVESDDEVVAPGTSGPERGLSLSGKCEVAVRYTLCGTVDDICLPAGDYTDYTELLADGNGNYGYWDTFTLEEDYRPLQWNLIVSDGSTKTNIVSAFYGALPSTLKEEATAFGWNDGGYSLFKAVPLMHELFRNFDRDGVVYRQTLETALAPLIPGAYDFDLEVNETADAFTLSFSCPANTELNHTFTFSYEWPFQQDDDAWLFDKADTYLGNWAAVKMGEIINGFVEPIGGSIEVRSFLAGDLDIID